MKLPITIIDELSDDEVRSQGELDLASGEIRNVRYEDGYDLEEQGMPAAHEEYEFTVGVLRNGAREVEFRIEVDALGGRYSVDFAFLNNTWLITNQCVDADPRTIGEKLGSASASP